MLVGYNTNIPYKGKLYHVQTEDNGLKNPVVITLLYFKGTILAAKKMSYAHLASDADYKQQVRELMKEQHKSMMKELIQGKHTGQVEEEKPGEPQAAAQETGGQEQEETTVKGRISKSLDDVLLDYILKRGE
ncbi:MAG: hypothetical protein M0Z79_08780 [Nitrospiraceae bacterium]|nr:hypothetical protein [Nitrospiraceae bacterium]